jgi:RNA recognition motif-containing protein
MDFMNKKLYVGGLSYSTTTEGLRDFFSQAGNIDSVNIVTDRDTGRSKGFAFVEMSTGEEAQTAIERFNGVELDGRRIVVNEARPQAPRENRNREGGGGRGWGGGGGGGGGNQRGGNRW